MKRWISAFLAIILLQVSCSLGQVLRLPTLIHHFQEHQQEDPEGTFFDFVAQHYAPEINHPDDEHRDHENLPFKTADFSVLQVVKIIHHSAESFELHQPEFERIKLTFSPFNFYNAYLSNIWQPPRWV
ncbi:MAG: hypothetical protein ACK4GL_07380 [Flavobacteriales bacterium]